ncbi:hypothetical protein FACS189494_01160 [Spirochaetia bacterium]|nr:hypothetical protein FACS189494_01160 [Spirochaetia bacterium]
MNYADVLYRTDNATEVIDGITEKYGYYFRIDNKIYRAVPIEEIRQTLSKLKEKGGHDLEVAAFEKMYKDAGDFVHADRLEESEITEKKLNSNKLFIILKLRQMNTYKRIRLRWYYEYSE